MTRAHEPKSKTTTAIILAAGLGTRMRSTLPKAVHPLGGRPMLKHLITTVEKLVDEIIVVTGPDMPEVEASAAPWRCVTQTQRLGTGHAAKVALPHVQDGCVVVLYADNPLIRLETLRSLVSKRDAEDSVLTLLAMRPEDTRQYGRLVVEGTHVRAIVEWQDASDAERALTLCNAGALCAQTSDLRQWLDEIDNKNTQQEYYLTDVVGRAARKGHVAYVEAPEDELIGVNSLSELAQAEGLLQQRLRQEMLDSGVTLLAPETVFFSADTFIEPDVTVEPHVVFGSHVTVRSGARIRAFSHLEGCDVGPKCVIGPYARLRPGTVCGEASHVGNFVELKATRLAEGVKANHLSYLGDTDIGARTNIGAGTITCNYDGVFKHETRIGSDVFVGSDAVLVAPLVIEDEALIAAGSVITENVTSGALALGRSRQVIKAHRGREIREKLRQKRDQN